MALSLNQKYTLLFLNEQKSISKGDCRFHANTMNSLYSKGLISLSRFANGEFWQLTDVGIDFVVPKQNNNLMLAMQHKDGSRCIIEAKNENHFIRLKLRFERRGYKQIPYVKEINKESYPF